MSAQFAAETIETHGCSIVLRRLEGPAARELFLQCQPPAGVADARLQADAIYRALIGALQAEGASFASVISETVFLRNMRASVEPVRAARRQAIAAGIERIDGPANHPQPATTFIEQPPLDEHAHLEVSVQALVPHVGAARHRLIEAPSRCPCAECAQTHGLLVHIGKEARFHAAGLCGAGTTAHEQTLGMFARAEQLLQQAGMEFSDVVRAWIYLRDIERDYGDLNRARRDFFAARGIDPAPASTGIGGAPIAEGHDLCLGVYAVVKADLRPPTRVVMTSPTLNEATQYGADFVRGMRVEEANKISLYVSGTASIDEHGRTAHIGDFEAQADRMLVNIAALLQRQRATFSDVVHAITYLKHPADAERLRSKLHTAGFEGFPHALVVAPVCRPELLCETEAIAVLRRD